MNCIVCKSDLVSVYKIIDSKKYWDCKFCFARFLDKNHHLEPSLERERYLLHENRIDDKAYRDFLSKLANPLKEKLSKKSAGLDYGCGEGPALADIFTSLGFKMNLYDPFFFPDKDIFLKKYDFITCTEVVEHFYSPFKEFIFLDGLLEKEGWLGIMTSFLPTDELFKNWYYRKDPTHVVFYTKETFEVIASQRNWSLEIESKDVVLFYKN